MPRQPVTPRKIRVLPTPQPKVVAFARLEAAAERIAAERYQHCLAIRRNAGNGVQWGRP